MRQYATSRRRLGASILRMLHYGYISAQAKLLRTVAICIAISSLSQKNCGFPRLHSNYKAIKLSLAWNSKNCSQCGHHSSSRSSKTRCRALHNQILSDDQTSSRYGPTNQNRVRVQIFTCKRESANRLNCFRITRLSLGQMCPLEKREGKWPAAHFGQDSSKYRSSRLGFSYFQPSIPKVV